MVQILVCSYHLVCNNYHLEKEQHLESLQCPEHWASTEKNRSNSKTPKAIQILKKSLKELPTLQLLLPSPPPQGYQ